MRRPAFWLACFFGGGIVLSAAVGDLPVIPFAALSVAAAAAGALIREERKASLATLSAAFLAGAFVSALHERCLERSDLRTLFGDRPATVTVRGTVCRSPAWERESDERGKPRWRGVGVLEISSAELARGWEPLNEAVRIVWLAASPAPLACGDEIETRCVLRRIREASNPGQFDGRSFWKRRGLQYTCTASGNSRVIRGGGGKALRFARWVDTARRRLKKGIEMGMPEGHERDLIVAMLLGYRERLDEETARAFRLTNTYHIVAISGLNVGFVYLLVRGVLRAARIPRRAAALTAIPLIFAHAVVTGAEIPVMRATVMFTAFLAAPILRARSDMVNSLGVAALALLACNPPLLFDLGFQLSFAAVLSLLLFAGPLSRCAFAFMPCAPLTGQLLVTKTERARWFVCRNLIALCSASVAAWIGLAPLIARGFNLVTALGVIGNIVVIPAGFAIVCLGFSGALISLVCAPLARLVNLANWASAWLMCAAIGRIARIPGSWLYVRSPCPAAMLIYYATAAAALAMLKGAVRGRWKALVVSAALLLPLLPPALRRDPPVMRITFLDVGQGDSACVEFPDGGILLVDAGPGGGASAGRRVVAPFIRSLGRSRVETALLTHAHDDHWGGFGAVLREFQMNRAVIGARGPAPPPPPGAHSGLTPAGGPLVKVREGDILAEGKGVRITVLNPRGGEHLPTQSGENNSSVALLVSFGRTRALLCGDMERAAEERLCGSGLCLKADLLKVGHHGSASSSTEKFLRMVSPKWAVISAGASNRFGHPSPKTLARLREAGSVVLRTDLHGAVTFISDGERWEMKTFR